jgi:hypothetical protein
VLSLGRTPGGSEGERHGTAVEASS